MKKEKDEFTFEFRHIADVNPKDIVRAAEFCEGYKSFLDHGKTEREVVSTVCALAEKEGYQPFDTGKKYKAGSRLYYVNRGKSIILVTKGKKSLAEGALLNIAHIDSPRIDLRPNPLTEMNEIAYFKTHYYGGIRKHQWSVTPLAMHGTVIRRDGSKVELSIGENPGDPQFVISDLLPHLSAEQDKRTLKEAIKGEELNIVVGSLPFELKKDKKTENAYKRKALQLLHDCYGITEADFMRAEIEFVPAVKATDIGLDRSLIGAYGQDDRVCAYPAVMAAFAVKKPELTTITVLTDKEEIGSMGNTGMQSNYVCDLMEDLCEAEGVKVRDCFRKSLCLSSDVGAAYDPSFPDVFEKNNSCYLNHGPVLTKYTGSRGKSSSSDASAETMAAVIKKMDDAGVIWQIGELGKIDAGGGGTIAQYIANRNVDTVDLGVPVLAMHAPFEITSKLDVYYTYLAFKAFFS